MEKTFEIKYNIGDEYSFIINNKTIKGKIDQYRIIVEKDKTKIHYLMIVPEYETMVGIYSNNMWVEENMLIIQK